MSQSPISSVISLIDIGLKPSEHYVQFVPPATFGIILDRATKKTYLVRADGQKTVLRHIPDKVYSLRGFVGLRQREKREMALGHKIEDEMIRNIISTFESSEELHEAVEEYCPYEPSADVILTVWAREVFGDTTDTHECAAVNPMYTAYPTLNQPMLKNYGEVYATGASISISNNPFQGIYSGVPSLNSINGVCNSEYETLQGPSCFQQGTKEWQLTSFDNGIQSLQEIEQYTLPIAFIQSQPVQQAIPSAALPPSLTAKEIGSMFPESIMQKMEYNPVPITPSPAPPFSLHPPYPRFLSAPSKAAVVNPTPAPRISGPPAQNATMPTWTMSQPTKQDNSMSTVPSRKRSYDESVKMKDLTSAPEPNFMAPLLAEIKVLASLHVLRTRRSPLETKLQLATEFVSGFNLPNQSDMIAQCYAALDSEIDNAVKRMKNFFLNEGLKYRQMYSDEGYTHFLPQEGLSIHGCNTCDPCLTQFFWHVELADIIDISAVLGNFELRAGIAKVYRCGMQLGIKAAWDGLLRERGFDACFNSLDRYTAGLEFPRKREIDYKNFGYGNNGETMRRVLT